MSQWRTMTTQQAAEADAIVADAKNPAKTRNEVLFRMTKLGHLIGGDDRVALDAIVNQHLKDRDHVVYGG